MTAPASSPARNWGAIFFVIALVLCGLRTVDTLRLEAAAPSIAETRAAGGSRVFVLLIDSLRYETAMNPDWMSGLAKLRRQGEHARLKTVYEGFTGPALRAAFAGPAAASVFSVVHNFRHRDLGVPSLFSAMSELGMSSAAFSAGHFTQFGQAVKQLLPPGPAGEDMYAADRRIPDAAWERFRSGTDALVIANVHTGDWLAHQVGVGAPEYVAEFRSIDAVASRLVDQLPRGATFALMGDHGHNQRGEHKTGMDIPTYLGVVGPGFVPGRDLGGLDMTAVRGIFSVALGLQTRAPSPPARSREPDRWLIVPLGLLGAVAVSYLWPPDRPAFKVGALWGWLSLALTFAPVPIGPWLASAVAAAHVALSERRLAVAVGVPLAFYFLTALGAAAAHVAPASATLPWLGRELPALWLAVVLLIAASPWRFRVLWPVFGASALALYPVLRTIGFGRESVLAPLLVAVAALVVVEARYRRALGPQTLVPALLAVGFAAPVLAVTDGLPGRAALRIPTGPELVALGLAALLAKLIVFLPLGGTRRDRIAALVIVAVLSLLQWEVPRNLLSRSDRWVFVALAAALLMAWDLLRHRWPAASRLAGLALLYVLYYACIQTSNYAYAWADGVIAAIVLNARGIAALGAQKRHFAVSPLLGVAALLLASEAAIGWNVAGIEWQALYRWFPAALIELNPAPFVPFIVLKTLLPYAIARAWLARTLPWRAAEMRLAAAVHVLGLLAFAAGLALAGAPPDLGLAAVEAVATALILFSGTIA